MHARLDRTAMAILIVLCASWGLQQVAIKAALPEVPPVLQGSVRSIVATLLLGLWMVFRRKPILVRDGTLLWGVAAGLLFAGEFVLMYWGLQFTQASRSVVLLYLAPFVVALGSHWFLPGDRLRRMQVAGLVCAFLGILVAFGESMGMPTNEMLIGDLMMIGAAVLWGATTVLVKASPLAGITASRTLLYQLSISALVLPLGSILFGESLPETLIAPVVASLVYQSLWVAFITYLFWFWLVRRYSVPRLASFTFLTPLFGVALGGWLLDEPMTRSLLIALVLVGVGIYLVNRPASEVPPLPA